MSALLRRLGYASAAHPWRTFGAWILVLGIALVLAGAWGGDLRDDGAVPGLPSQAGSELLAQRFPQEAGADARVVLHGPGPLDDTVGGRRPEPAAAGAARGGRDDAAAVGGRRHGAAAGGLRPTA